MTSPYLAADIRRDEGDKLRAYPDPLTHAAPWTIGVGDTHGFHGEGIQPGETITEAQSTELESQDIALVIAGLDRNLPWWRGMSDLRQDVFANMVYNLGLTKFLTFRTFLAFAKAADYHHAALDMLGTAWAHELPKRAKRLSEQMATGARQP